MRLAALLTLAVALLPATALTAQDLPPYVPVNPLLASRSALYAQPFISRSPGWHVQTIINYSNAIEYDDSRDRRRYLFDAEVLQADLWVTRDLSRHLFVLGEVPIRGGYSGVLDGFLNWYHDLLGLTVLGRHQRPNDVFGWTFAFPDTAVDRTAPGTFIGDVRAGAGVRLGNSQLLLSATLPTTPTSKDGWNRGVVGTSLAFTSRVMQTPRVAIDAGASLGFTPTHGALARYQRSTFGAGMVGLRWRFAGSQAVFGTLWLQSANWKNSGFGSVDDAEVTLDFGGLLRLGKHWPELQLGMTEDVKPSGPAIDAGFKLGLRWR